ncbi:Acg family FMN-binding oxidoreductase [Frigidibacter mobilis]|uniref:Putative signal peptide protein n=1 Tax=Frigidibacter mobilis TaxID=1335048 RepID=A0A159Z474_9RHOB|nr:nitroreductase family protein [Frigidibacter mobilis]AMY69906.1 putative signal peptide protein [Frigidibacter mobilis]
MKRRSIMTGAAATLALGGAGIASWCRAAGSQTSYDRYIARLRAPLGNNPPMADLLRTASLAASGHNTQPWQFDVRPGTIILRPDLSCTTPVVDPDDHHLIVSLGCAMETLAIAASGTGRPGEADPIGGLVYRHTEGPPRPGPLLAAIPARQSTRADYDGRAVPAADLAQLERAGTGPGVRLILITDRPRMNQIRDLVIAGNTTQMADPAFIAELKHWLRFSPRSAMETGDGLYAAASGNPVLPDAFGRFAFDQVFTTAAENDKYARHLSTSAGLAVFVADREDTAHWVAVGRACQRFALTATALGLKHAFLNQPVEVAALRPELASLIGEPGKRPDLVMRFGYGPTLPWSPRREVQL